MPVVTKSVLSSLWTPALQLSFICTTDIINAITPNEVITTPIILNAVCILPEYSTMLTICITGSIYVVNNTIADYRIGDNVTLNSLNFITTSNYKKETSRNFEGKVSFWNYNANKYEEVFDSSNDKRITDFTNYIGGNNTIKMKFEVKSDGIGYNVPMISAVVTQK